MPAAYPGFNSPRSMAEVMLVAPDHGSIANPSPSGLGTVPSEDIIDRRVYQAMFNDARRNLGEIALIGQLIRISYPPHITHVSTLFGDPAGMTKMSGVPTSITMSELRVSSNGKSAALAPVIGLGLVGALVTGL
jgi:hypothetical protein